MERPKFEHDNPAKESMNNFHGHFPGGIYRPDSDLTGPLWDMFGPLLNQDESSWPEKDKRLLASMKTKREIQRDIDDYLQENVSHLEKWQELEPLFTGGGSYAMREQMLRPIYVLLREKYLEDDLSS